MISSKELLLFDTNVLVYAHNKKSKYFNVAYSLLKIVQEGKLKAVVAHQNLLEFYAIVTNPDRVEKPLSQTQAKREVQNYLGSRFNIIQPNEKTLGLFIELLRAKRVRNREVFDCYLVATMLSNGVKTIYTANEKDFQKYPEIRAANPFSRK